MGVGSHCERKRRFRSRLPGGLWIMALMIAVLLAPVVPATAAQGLSAVTTINGTRVAWGEEWVENRELSGPAEVAADADAHGVTVLVGDVPDVGSLQELFDNVLTAYQEGYVVKDSGQTPDGGHYALWDAASGNHLMGRVMHAPGSTVPIVIMVVIEPGFVESALVALRTFTVNDVPAWDGADDAAIVEHLVIGTPSLPVFPAVVQEEDASGPGQGSMRPEGTRAPSVHSLESLVAGGSPRGDAQGGMTGSYTSDQFPYTIEWDATWQTQDHWQVSDEAKGIDSLTVEAVHPTQGAVKVYVAGQIDGYTIDDAIQYWTSDAYLGEFQPAGTEVVLVDSGRNSGAVVLVGPSPVDGDPELWVTVIGLTFAEQELEVESHVLAPLSHFPTVYANAEQGILMQHDAMIGYFTLEDILDVLPPG